MTRERTEPNLFVDPSQCSVAIREWITQTTKGKQRESFEVLLGLTDPGIVIAALGRLKPGTTNLLLSGDISLQQHFATQLARRILLVGMENRGIVLPGTNDPLVDKDRCGIWLNAIDRRINNREEYYEKIKHFLEYLSFTQLPNTRNVDELNFMDFLQKLGSNIAKED